MRGRLWGWCLCSVIFFGVSLGQVNQSDAATGPDDPTFPPPSSVTEPGDSAPSADHVRLPTEPPRFDPNDPAAKRAKSEFEQRRTAARPAESSSRSAPWADPWAEPSDRPPADRSVAVPVRPAEVSDRPPLDTDRPPADTDRPPADTDRSATRATGAHRWPMSWHRTAACASLSEMKLGHEIAP